MFFVPAFLLVAAIPLLSDRLAKPALLLSAVLSLALFLNTLLYQQWTLASYFTLLSALLWFCISLYSLSAENACRKHAILLPLSYASMLLIMWARDALSFLVGWEVMTIASYFSIRDERPAYAFLAFGELSALLVTVGFAAGIATTGSVLIDSWAYSGYWWLVFLLASLGFAVKMEIWPFHIWAPSAYSSSPSNFSALMSSCLTLMGVYGILRLLSVATPPEWVATVMLVLGAVTAVYGALHAATSERVKELPAYSTIENDGIMFVLLGAYIVASNSVNSDAAFALVAVLFYAFFHSTSKALLLLTVGDGRFGPKVRKAAVAFAGCVAAFSLAAIPPMPGFAAEWMALETLFQSFNLHTPLKLLVVLTGALVALAAGISAISMSKVAVYSFLSGSSSGRDGKDKGEVAGEADVFEKLSLLILSAAVLFAGILPQYILKYVSAPVSRITGYKGDFLGGLLMIPKGMLIVSGKGFGCISPTVLALFLLGISAAVFIVFRLSLKGVRFDEPWNGGEESENYTPEAYSMILRLTLKSFYRTRELVCGVLWCDLVETLYVRASRMFTKFCDFIRVTLMNGSVGLYVLYILVAMLALLIYALL